MRVVYVTKSDFKKKENEVFVEHCVLTDGSPIKGNFEFELRHVDVKEILEVELESMVMDEVAKAYSEIKVPCIVKHVGPVFDPHSHCPGGLTKPMWNCLDTSFIAETGAAGRSAKARAVVAYCDGKQIRTFVGETQGTIASSPRGSRRFYWDTVFIPDGSANQTFKAP